MGPWRRRWGESDALPANAACGRIRFASIWWPILLQRAQASRPRSTIRPELALSGQIGVQVFLDSDVNPYNGNEIIVSDQTLPKTGTLVVSLATVTGTPDAALVAPGSYAVSAHVSDGALAQSVCPELLTVTPSQQPPSIDSMILTGGVMHFTVHGLPGSK